ncbi:ferredoxin reductase [Rhodococcus wratislaviensis IFP 2016]|uniref:Ferredoxin reductase n=1 Tax=Rhodococcus opacus M213 TaxID=1129896 RepID=K8XYK6_RHOOP|nr:ferredoxin reductase [Rhodococcus opacus M213]ELB93527.1 ferredoxin reductase [Rhodococcus wratislaviensis IFP 2016]
MLTHEGAAAITELLATLTMEFPEKADRFLLRAFAYRRNVILEVLEENGIEVFKSCEEGICGSCVSGVLEGEPEHRDNCLTAADRAAGNQMAPVCRARSRNVW